MSRREPRAGVWAHVWTVVLDVDRFVRLHFLFFSCLWPLLGATSVRRDVALPTLAAILVVAACFHVYAFVLNDVIDFPIDRTQPLRQRDPLVRGAVTRRQALALALLQPCLAAGLTVWLGGSVNALVTLGIGFAAMAVYNVWGKRCAVPPLTDAVQGIAWGSLAVYAPYALGAVPNVMTWMVGAYAVGYTLFMNGVHGGLRDLANDLTHGARTTAIFLGAQPLGSRDPYVPKAVAVFTSAALAFLVAITVLLVVRNDRGYGAAALTVTALLVGALQLGAVLLMPHVVSPRAGVWDLAFRVQMYFALMALPAFFIPAAGATALVALAVLQCVSLAVLEPTAVVLRWCWTVMRRAAGISSEERLRPGVARTER